MIHTVREDETGYQDFTLYDENGPFDGSTGSPTVSMILADRVGGIVDMTNKVAWLVAANGSVRVSPAVGDLKAERAPYTAVYIVTLNTLTYAFPNREPDTWKVWK